MLWRYLHERVRESLRTFPVVLITGARQVGKSTLAQSLIEAGWAASYLTLDDRAVLDAALRDPDGFLAGTPTPVVLDEVQRAPDLMRALKLVVDRQRKPGQYLLTGSANVTTLAAVSESLAGRVALHELQPFCWAELSRKPFPTTLADLFAAGDARALLSRWPRRRVPERAEEMKEFILSGGYPTPALMESHVARQRWFASYRQTYIDRDVRDLAAIANVPEFNRLLALAAARTGHLLNLSDLARDLDLPFTTLRRYLGLLGQTYQIFTLQPYFTNVGKRVVKTPKLYAADTGMACHLTAADSWDVLERQGRVGALVETFVAAELGKLRAASDPLFNLYFWRTHGGREVDFLIEHGEELVAVEVKSSYRIEPSDLAGCKSCAEAMGKRLRFSVVLYSGVETVAFDPRTIAVPFSVFFGLEE